VDVVLEVGVMTAEELLERYAAGERDFSGVDLSGVNLMEVNLEDVNLACAILRETQFQRSLLNGAIFKSADLEGADFFLASLDRTDFRAANLSRCRIVEASLIRANFDGAIEGVISEGYNLGGYTYKTIMPDGRVETCDDPGRDRAIAKGKRGFWDGPIESS
jgi:uncharacterized protein YjbI with pentapeptide repeats